MKNQAIIPDSAILLDPPTGNSSDIRISGKGWTTKTNEDRIIVLQIGDPLKKGGSVKLVDYYNVKEFVLEVTNRTDVITRKVIVPNYFIFL